MVVHGQQRVDEGLLALLLVVAPVEFRLQGDLTQQSEGEEQPDDAAVDDEGRDRIERGVGCDHHRQEGQDEADRHAGLASLTDEMDDGPYDQNENDDPGEPAEEPVVTGRVLLGAAR